jgi:8-oxo-dGTP pyrophosphatase MutT (NUDIX family)
VKSTDLTVAAVVRQGERYLIVEERSGGRDVLTQPAGHIESGESPEDALVREVLEESGCTVECGKLIGVYLWQHPDTGRRYLRLVYSAGFVTCDESLELDTPIIARHWMTRTELEAASARLRTPVVLRCIHDYEAGRREPRSLLGLGPVENNLQQVIDRARLV